MSLRDLITKHSNKCCLLITTMLELYSIARKLKVSILSITGSKRFYEVITKYVSSVQKHFKTKFK